MLKYAIIDDTGIVDDSNDLEELINIMNNEKEVNDRNFKSRILLVKLIQEF